MRERGIREDAAIKRRKGIRLCNNLILIMRNRILARMNRVLIRLYTDSSSSFTFPVCERERERD